MEAKVLPPVRWIPPWIPPTLATSTSGDPLHFSKEKSSAQEVNPNDSQKPPDNSSIVPTPSNTLPTLAAHSNHKPTTTPPATLLSSTTKAGSLDSTVQASSTQFSSHEPHISKVDPFVAEPTILAHDSRHEMLIEEGKMVSPPAATVAQENTNEQVDTHDSEASSSVSPLAASTTLPCDSSQVN